MRFCVSATPSYSIGRLDNKAGILLGFAGALAAIAPGGWDLWVTPGRAAAVIAAVFAVRAYWPRKFRDMDVRGLRDRHVDNPSGAFVTRRMLRDELAEKAKRLKIALVALVIAAALIAVRGG
jgi:hypothetical protein